MNARPTLLELLAPARDLETAIAAINSGADAIYIGASSHGARASAANSVADIRKLCEYAHQYRVKIYVTLNTLVYENEIHEVERLVHDLYRAGVDALIVQDMALLEMDIPPIQLHASTQCDIRTPEKARFLADVGFSQLVLPREMSLEDIRAVRQATDTPLEVFVHGALCVSYSGDCRASFVNGGRSANRGECAQICRLPYDLIDGDGNIIEKNKHLLSLRDMNRMAQLGELADAGVTSFKIEGRLKSADYVKNIVAVYSRALNDFITANPDKYARQSFGQSEIRFTPDPAKSFNRGFTSYFLNDTQPGASQLASIYTPKHVGERVGTILSASPRKLIIKGTTPIVNGDGLGFFDSDKHFVGFRANKVDGAMVQLNAPLESMPQKGTPIYRNFDKTFADTLKAEPTRKIRLDITAERIPDGIALTLSDERGCYVTLAQKGEYESAKSPQEANRQRILSKLGDTIYSVNTVSDKLGDIFIPASELTDLRRRAVEALDTSARATYIRPLRSESKPNLRALPSAANIANPLASRFYAKHGVTRTEKAVEVTDAAELAEDIRVMTTRYCVRRELGCCLKTPEGKNIKGPLKLKPVNAGVREMRLEFDCSNCRMNVIALANTSQKGNN